MLCGCNFILLNTSPYLSQYLEKTKICYIALAILAISFLASIICVIWSKNKTISKIGAGISVLMIILMFGLITCSSTVSPFSTNFVNQKIVKVYGEEKEEKIVTCTLEKRNGLYYKNNIDSSTYEFYISSITGKDSSLYNTATKILTTEPGPNVKVKFSNKYKKTTLIYYKHYREVVSYDIPKLPWYRKPFLKANYGKIKENLKGTMDVGDYFVIYIPDD